MVGRALWLTGTPNARARTADRHQPRPDSTLAYLLRVPLGDGIILRTAGTWPRTKALYCYPVPADEWPDDPDIVDRVPLRSCVRRGAAIDIVAARCQENRSQLVFTTARGRDAVFWQSPRTRKQARPQVSLPTARAAGITELEIVVDAHERYAYRFAGQQVRTTSRAPALRRLRDHPRRGPRRRGRTQVPARPDRQPDQRPAPLRPRRAGRPAPRRGGGRGPLLADLQAGPGPALARRRRDRRVPGPLAQHPHRVLRHPQPGRGMDLPLPGRRPRLGLHRDRPPSNESASSRPCGPSRTSQTGPSPAEIRDWARRNGIDVPDRGRIPASIRQAWVRSTSPPDL